MAAKDAPIQGRSKQRGRSTRLLCNRESSKKAFVNSRQSGLVLRLPMYNLHRLQNGRRTHCPNRGKGDRNIGAIPLFILTFLHFPGQENTLFTSLPFFSESVDEKFLLHRSRPWDGDPKAPW